MLAIWLCASALLVALWSVGYSPMHDVDDLLKAVEIRHFAAAGSLFDRTLPGILQPEPFVSHWPWIVDLPYAAAAVLLRPFVGLDAALQAAFFAVPLLLLLPLLACLRRTVGALGFADPDAAFTVATALSFGAVLEFQPGRIDYHNLQMLALAASLALTLTPGPRAALLNGAVTALAFAVGLELSLLFLATMAVHAAGFVLGRPQGGRRLALFGLGLGVSAAALFPLVVAPADYGVGLCDRFTLPPALALVAAGLAFAAAPALVGQRGPAMRAGFLGLCGAAAGAALMAAFPDCAKGPYALLSDYAREHWMSQIGQEKSIFQRPEMVLDPAWTQVAITLAGALAPFGIACLVPSRRREWAIQGLLGLVAVLQALLLVRYMRFVPLLAGPGLAFAIQALRDPATLGPRLSRLRFAPLVPGLALSLALLLFHATRPAPATGREAADLAALCDMEHLRAGHWPAEARVLPPPMVGTYLLGKTDATVTAISFHRSALGAERAVRFFDPATPEADRERIARAAGATHVALCALPEGPIPDLERMMPFTAGLMTGRAPSWLEACPQAGDGVLRVYRVREAPLPGGICPVSD